MISKRMFKDTRHGEEKAAMAAIYAALTFMDMGEEVDVVSIVGSVCGEEYADCPYFVKSMVVNSLKYYDEAVGAISEHLVKWTFGRLNRVAQAILLLSYTQYFHFDEAVAKAVVIDNAVQMAKEYLEKNDYRFINAVLDKVLR